MQSLTGGTALPSIDLLQRLSSMVTPAPTSQARADEIHHTKMFSARRMASMAALSLQVGKTRLQIKALMATATATRTNQTSVLPVDAGSGFPYLRFISVLRLWLDDAPWWAQIHIYRITM